MTVLSGIASMESIKVRSQFKQIMGKRQKKLILTSMFDAHNVQTEYVKIKTQRKISQWRGIDAIKNIRNSNE